MMQEQPTLCNKATFGADVPKVVVVQKHKLILLAAIFRYMTCVQEATFSMQKFWCKIIILCFHFFATQAPCLQRSLSLSLRSQLKAVYIITAVVKALTAFV